MYELLCNARLVAANISQCCERERLTSVSGEDGLHGLQLFNMIAAPICKMVIGMQFAEGNDFREQ